MWGGAISPALEGTSQIPRNGGVDIAGPNAAGGMGRAMLNTIFWLWGGPFCGSVGRRHHQVTPKNCHYPLFSRTQANKPHHQTKTWGSQGQHNTITKNKSPPPHYSYFTILLTPSRYTEEDLGWKGHRALLSPKMVLSASLTAPPINNDGDFRRTTSPNGGSTAEGG